MVYIAITQYIITRILVKFCNDISYYCISSGSAWATFNSNSFNMCARLSRKAMMELVPENNTNSIVWTYFGFEPRVHGQPENSDNPKCRLCFEKGVSKSVYIKGGNTSIRFSHLHVCFHHPKELAIVQEAKTTGKTLKEKSSGSKQVTIADVSKYPRSSKRWQSVYNSYSHNLLSKR